MTPLFPDDAKRFSLPPDDQFDTVIENLRGHPSINLEREVLKVGLEVLSTWAGGGLPAAATSQEWVALVQQGIELWKNQKGA